MTTAPPEPPEANVVRRARRGDAPALVALRALMFEAMGTPSVALDDPRWRVGAERWFTDRVDDPRVCLAVAEVGGEVVASAVGEVTALIPGPSCPDGAVGLVSSVATLPTHRGRGHASACARLVLDWFVDDTDVSRIDLFATPAGARLYEPEGFVTSAYPAMRRAVARD